MFLRPAARRAAATLASAVCLSTSSSSDGRRRNARHDEYIGVFLKPESREILSRRLAALGLKDYEAEVAILNEDPTFDDIFTYEPLFGEKAAFRLTGITSDGQSIKVHILRYRYSVNANRCRGSEECPP